MGYEQVSTVLHQKLDFGDYACTLEDGYIIPMIFERKSIGDLYGTMGKGYKRFKKAIGRAQSSSSTMAIIVEGTLTEVLAGYEHSKRSGISIVRQLNTIYFRYGIPTIYCAGRTEMTEYIYQFFYGAGSEHMRRKV